MKGNEKDYRLATDPHACFHGQSTSTNSRPSASSAQPSVAPKAGAARPKTGAGTARSPFDRALLRPAMLKDQAPDTYQVKFETTRGDFTVAVTRAWAPVGADRFYNLVKHHFYNNARFFRVVPG